MPHAQRIACGNAPRNPQPAPAHGAHRQQLQHVGLFFVAFLPAGLPRQGVFLILWRGKCKRITQHQQLFTQLWQQFQHERARRFGIAAHKLRIRPLGGPVQPWFGNILRAHGKGEGHAQKPRSHPTGR